MDHMNSNHFVDFPEWCNLPTILKLIVSHELWLLGPINSITLANM